MSETQEKGQTGFPSPSREGDPSQEPGLHGNEGDSAERLVSAGSLGEDKDGDRGPDLQKGDRLIHLAMEGFQPVLSSLHPAVRTSISSGLEKGLVPPGDHFQTLMGVPRSTLLVLQRV